MLKLNLSKGLIIRHEFYYQQAIEEFTEPEIEDQPLENPIA